MRPLISVIVPVFNCINTLQKSVDSLLCQTYDNFEILLIDDGSIDGSSNLCDDIASADDRAIVFHKENGGVSEARNLGLTKAKGDYIFFCDADDWIEPNTIELLYSVIIDTDADVAVANICFESNDKTISPLGDFNREYFTGKEAMIEMHRNKYFAGYCCNKLFKRRVLSNANFEVGLTIYEDMLFCGYAFNNSDKVVFVNEYTYHYLQNENSALHREYRETFWDILKASKELMLQMEKFNPSGIDSAKVTLISSCLNLTFKLFDSNRLDKKNYSNIRVEVLEVLSCNTWLKLPNWQKKNLLFFLCGKDIYCSYLMIKNKLRG